MSGAPEEGALRDLVWEATVVGWDWAIGVPNVVFHWLDRRRQH